MIFWIAPVLFWLSGKAQGYVDFLRSIPSLLAPKPIPLDSVPYTPPFTGGQCAGISYRVHILMAYNGNYNQFPYRWSYVQVGSISPPSILELFGGSAFAFLKPDGTRLGGENFDNTRRTWKIEYVDRIDGLADNCGNLGNPIPAPSIPDDGLFSPTNPVIADDNGTVNPAAIVLAPALPLILIPAILAGYGAALAAAKAASDALEAIKKIAEGLESLKDLWGKLKEFLDEWEKNRPKKRDVVRQTYGQLIGDGALDFFPVNNQKYQSIQLDVVITTIPIGFGKFFGSFSPHRYRYKELGYIAFYSTTQGILEVRTLEFKRTSLQIPKLAVGFIYHLGLDDQIKGYAFGTFSVEKS